MAAKAPDNVLEKKKETPKKHKSVRGTGRTGAPAANDAIKYRIKPTDEQYQRICQGIGNARYYWNLIIDIALITHELAQDGDPDVPRSLYPTPKEAKRLEGCEFLALTDTLILDNVKKNYEQAWANHKKNPKHYGRPTWKKREGLKGSYTTNNHPKWDTETKSYTSEGNIRIEDGKICLPRVGWVKLVEHSHLPEGAVIKNVTVSRDAAGKCFVSVGYYNPELAELLTSMGFDESKDHYVIEGLDYSNPLMFVSTGGFHPKDLHYYRQSEAKLARLQRKLAKREKGSSNYRKLSARIGRLHRRIANQRTDLLHKLSRALADSCDIVCVEDLDLKALARKKKGFHLGKNLHDNAWGKFLTYLEYKLERRGGALVRVGRYYPSSKRCHHCGAILDDLTLSTRAWDCPDCGAVHDRDVNAAWNIVLEAVRMLRAGEVAGAGVPDTASFSCAGGMPVAARVLEDGSLVSGHPGSGVVPVEGGKTWSGRASRWLELLAGDESTAKGSLGQREAGIKEVVTCGNPAGQTEAPSSALARA